MNSLKKFRDDISIGNGETIEAYRMDGKSWPKKIPDMRTDVELGKCNCCDRFFVFDDRVFLVEETDLHKTIRSNSKKYKYLRRCHKKEIITKIIRQENYVKVYGAMLVLCRLSAQYKDVAKVINNKKHNFWLVVEGTADTDSSIYFDNLKNKLLGQLRNVIDIKLFDQVEVVLLSDLPTKLKEHAPSP